MTARPYAQLHTDRLSGRAGIHRHSLFGVLALVAFGLGELVVFVVPRVAYLRQTQSHDVTRVADAALAEALEQEVAITRLLGSSGVEDQGVFQSNWDRLDASLDSLALLTANIPAQQDRVGAVAAAVRAWQTGVAGSAVKGAGSRVAAARQDAELFAPVRAGFDELRIAQEQLTDERRSQGRLVALLALVAVLLPGGAIAAVLVTGGRRSTQVADQLAEQQVQLEEQAVELEQQVQELEVANVELVESMELERQAREEATLEARERQRNTALLGAALHSSPVGISLLDYELRYLMVNEAIAQITGIPVADHVGRSLREVNPALSHDIEDLLRRVVATGEPMRNLEMIRPTGPTGRLRYLLLNVYPIRTPDGASIGLGVAAVDTTEQRELLEQFYHAQRLEAVGRLAAGIAHDFNNLLTVICSHCELALLDMPDGAVGREDITEILAAGDRAAKLSRQMVGLSRKQTILPRELAVGEAVRGMKSMLHHVTSDNVTLRFAFNEPLGIVKIDPTHLEQVLMNLVINAVDAMPHGGEIFVTVTNVTMDKDGAKRLHGLRQATHVEIAVRDTGTGMDAETMRRVFDPFFTTKGPGKGTGLGLSTVYGIVREAGGHVTVDSEVGEGTTFAVYLPAEIADEAARLHREPRADPVARAERNETILVVDDEDALRTMLARVLKGHGYVVLEAAHGGEAMRVSSEHAGRIDLVLSDFQMPGMHGQELIERLHEQRPEMKIVFMSGVSNSPDGSAYDSERASDRYPLLVKPFTIEALATQIRQALDA